ncbi:MAG TPA: hypothetical protein VHZ64_07650 [Xanthobacteraceae bacterium]|jgi:hypothetical protein|nr:hypothetical protein [Xanthobacteraceae bacterium]
MSIATISFNPGDLEECKRVVTGLQLLFETVHGAAATRSLFVERTKSKHEVQEAINFRLVTAQLESGLSVEKFAKKLAEKNKTLQKGQRHGTTGSINPDAIKRQIGRTKKEMKERGVYYNLASLCEEKSQEIARILKDKDNSQ